MKKKKINKFVKIFDYRRFLYDFIKITMSIFVLLDLRIKRIYVKDGKIVKRTKGMYKGSFLIISNHMSYEDPVIISNAFWERRLSFVATDELFKKKIFGSFLKACGTIPIDTQNISMGTFKTINKQYDRGHIVAIFPEGHVERGEKQFKQFKSGSVLIALNAEVPIIPIYIEKRANRFKRQKAYIGERIDLKGVLQARKANRSDQ